MRQSEVELEGVEGGHATLCVDGCEVEWSGVEGVQTHGCEVEWSE